MSLFKFALEISRGICSWSLTYSVPSFPFISISQLKFTCSKSTTIDVVLVSLLLTTFNTFSQCFYYWLLTSKCSRFQITVKDWNKGGHWYGYYGSQHLLVQGQQRKHMSHWCRSGVFIVKTLNSFHALLWCLRC